MPTGILLPAVSLLTLALAAPATGAGFPFPPQPTCMAATAAMAGSDGAGLVPVRQQPAPFHSGELGVQRRAGTQHSAAALGEGMITDQLAPDQAHYIRERRFLVLSSLSSLSSPAEEHEASPAQAPWSTILTGPRGFAMAPNGTRIQVRLPPERAVSQDPALASLRPGMPVGMLFIDLVTRGRLRVNAKLLQDTLADGAGKERFLLLQVLEAYGNCPKHIQQRVIGGEEFGEGQPAPAAEVALALTDEHQAIIARADTFFVATHHPGRGADSSHRGGHPGFVRVESPTSLWWADYAGNGMFNTLGNIEATGLAGLLFFDFATHTTLQLTGTASIEWLADEAEAIDSSRRLVRFEVTRAVLQRAWLPLTFSELDEDYESPFNPALTGVESDKPADDVEVTFVRKESVTDQVATFWFRVPLSPEAAVGVDAGSDATGGDAGTPSNGTRLQGLRRKLLCHTPGEYVTLRLPFGGGVVRTWTISSHPACLSLEPRANPLFSISVKRDDHGLASRWLHDELKPGEAVVATGVGGGTTVSCFMSWPIRSLAAVFEPPGSVASEADVRDVLRNAAYHIITMLSGGIGVTPMMANLRAFRQLQLLAARHGTTAGKGAMPSLPHVTFVHSNRSPAFVFADELLALRTAGVLARIVSVCVGWAPAHPADLDAAMPPDRLISVFLCGPTKFMAWARETLVTDLSLPSGFLHEEAFFF